MILNCITPRELEKLNFRDALIAKIALQGGKRINEALNLKVEQIGWTKHEITFFQFKTGGDYYLYTKCNGDSQEIYWRKDRTGLCDKK